MSVQDKFGYIKVIRNLRSKDRQWHRQNKTKRQTLHKEIKTKQHEAYKIPKQNSGAPEG